MHIEEVAHILNTDIITEYSLKSGLWRASFKDAKMYLPNSGIMKYKWKSFYGESGTSPVLAIASLKEQVYNKIVKVKNKEHYIPKLKK